MAPVEGVARVALSASSIAFSRASLSSRTFGSFLPIASPRAISGGSLPSGTEEQIAELLAHDEQHDDWDADWQSQILYSKTNTKTTSIITS